MYFKGQIMNEYKKVKNILMAILIVNLLVAFLKIIIGNYIGSYSVSADGLHSLSDSASNIIGIIGVMIASKPSDKEHPYGHQRIEYICAFVIAFIICIRKIVGIINHDEPSDKLVLNRFDEVFDGFTIFLLTLEKFVAELFILQKHFLIFIKEIMNELRMTLIVFGETVNYLIIIFHLLNDFVRASF